MVFSSKFPLNMRKWHPRRRTHHLCLNIASNLDFSSVANPVRQRFAASTIRTTTVVLVRPTQFKQIALPSSKNKRVEDCILSFSLSISHGGLLSRDRPEIQSASALPRHNQRLVYLRGSSRPAFSQARIQYYLKSHPTAAVLCLRMPTWWHYVFKFPWQRWNLEISRVLPIQPRLQYRILLRNISGRVEVAT
jgi:hypothetical protein